MLAIRPELARRIVWEAEAVEAKFPGRFRLALDSQGRPVWDGMVPVEGQPAPVIVTYPAAYPAVPPILETTASLPPDCPHLLGRNAGRATLCWIVPSAAARHRRWDPQHHTAATVMRAAQRWFLAFRIWRTLGRWPVPEGWQV